MFSFLVKGGLPFMLPIAACSVVSLAIFLERLWSLRRKKIIPQDFLIQVEDLVRREKIDDAMVLCRRYSSPIAHILSAGIKNFGKKREVVKERIEEVGRLETPELSRFLEIMSTVANVATLLGLLGTIAGLIEVFGVVSTSAVVSPPSLAHGISVALYTTAFGLSVAIPTVVGHRYLSGKVDSLVTQMEAISLDMLELLKEKGEEALA